MTKYPKTVCVVFNEFAQAMDARNNKKDATFYQKRNMGHVFKPYHLHPGNEVKLKRENAMMRDTLKALWDNRHVPSICINVATWEYIERKLPDLFKPNTKESK